MIDIVDSIGEIVSLLPGAPGYVYGDKAFRNLVADVNDYSNGVVFLYTPLTYQGYSPKVYPLLMFFGIPNELLDDPANVRVLQDQMKALSDQFIFRLQKYVDSNNYKLAQSVDKISRTEIENEYDVNLCGVVLQFNLTTYEYGSQCII